jgi:hypothetical protein
MRLLRRSGSPVRCKLSWMRFAVACGGIVKTERFVVVIGIVALFVVLTRPRPAIMPRMSYTLPPIDIQALRRKAVAMMALWYQPVYFDAKGIVVDREFAMVGFDLDADLDLVETWYG